MKIYYESQYSIDGKTWLRFLDRHNTQDMAITSAKSHCNEEFETRVVKVTTEVLNQFDKIPGKLVKSIILPGIGKISD